MNLSEAAIADLVENSDALCLLGVIVSDTNLGVSAMRLQLMEAMVARGAMSPTQARFVEGVKSKRA